MTKLKEKESDIQKGIIQYLGYLGALVVKINNVGVMKSNGQYIPPRQKGISDLIVLYKGRFIAAEIKSATGKLSEPQKVFLEDVNAKGGIGFVARSIDDVAEVLNKIK